MVSNLHLNSSAKIVLTRKTIFTDTPATSVWSISSFSLRESTTFCHNFLLLSLFQKPPQKNQNKKLKVCEKKEKRWERAAKAGGTAPATRGATPTPPRRLRPKLVDGGRKSSRSNMTGEKAHILGFEFQRVCMELLMSWQAETAEKVPAPG